MAKAPNNSSKKNKPIITLMVVVLCIGAILGVKFVMAKNRDQLTQLKTARVKGNPKAPIKIVEYIDFQCPACAAGANMIKEFMKTHPDQIFVEMKYYPLAMHTHAFISSYYAECASRQGKFWEFHDLLIGRQAMWSKLPEVKSVFDDMAKELELKMDKLEACVNDEKTKEVVMKTREEGDLLGVKSTPSYFVNDKLIVGSKNLESELSALLSK